MTTPTQPTEPTPTETQPATDGYLQRAVRIGLRLVFLFSVMAVVVYLVGESLLGNSPLVWLARLLALGIFVFGLTAWQRPLKLVHLPGDEDEWYLVKHWDGRMVGYQNAGWRWIAPVQTTAYWTRVTPILLKVDAQDIHNKVLDTFTVHMRVMFMCRPDWVASARSARWLHENYPDTMQAIAESILKDTAQEVLRTVDSFAASKEEETEQRLQEAIHQKFAAWAAHGIFLNEDMSLVDIMVSDDVLRKRLGARAELSRIQIIREVAHEMGISTDELLIQRALERLPDSRTRQSVSEIAAVLQMLRARPGQQQLPDHLASQAEPDQPEEVASAPESNPGDDDPPGGPNHYVEGYYEPVDDPDPDRDNDGTTGIYSPF